MAETSRDTIERHPWVRPALLAIGLALATWLAFEPSLDGTWLHWDDDRNFVENEAWRGLSAENLRWMATTFHQGPYQPLSWISLGFDFTRFGSAPRGYHVTNVLLQIGAGLAFFAFARALFARASGIARAPSCVRDVAAALAALLFAVHPLRVESVAWITERRDVLSGVFFALTCWAYVVFATTTGRARTRTHVLLLVCYAASLASKGLGFPLPIALLALDACVLDRWNGTWRGAASGDRRPLAALLREKAGLFLLAVVAAALAWHGQREFATPMSWSVHGPLARVVQSFFGLFFYAWKTIWPVDLIPLVRLDPPLELSERRFLVAIVVVCAISAVAWRHRRRARAFAGAWIAYAVLLAPVLGLTQTGPQLVADRYSYLSCMPLVLLAAGAGVRVWLARPWAGVATGLALLGCGFLLVPLSRAQSRVWHDDVSLWSHTVALEPLDAPAFRNLTLAYLRLAEAAEDPGFQRRLYESVRIEADRGLSRFQDAGLLSNAALACSHLSELAPERGAEYRDLALGYSRRAMIRTALEPKPTPSVYQNAGLLFVTYGLPEEAIAPFTWLAENTPGDAEKPLMLGQVLVQAGRLEEGLRALERAGELAPLSPRVWIWRAHALAGLDRKPEAITSLERGIALAEQLPPELAELPAEMAALRGLLASWKTP